MTEQIMPTKAQEAILRFRTHCSIISAGSRGSGKSVAMMLDCIDHCRTFGPDARPLILREQWGALHELMSELYWMAQAAFGSAKRNKSEGTITLPTGGIITFSNVCDDTAYARHQGSSYSGIFADELGNYPPQAIQFVNRLKSNLRVKPGQRAHFHATMNPFGRSHAYCVREWIGKAPPWSIFEDASGTQHVVCVSNFIDNPHIDRPQYRKQLVASTGGDEALAKAWIEGDWSTLGGSLFSPPYDPAYHVLPHPIAHSRREARYLVGCDWGVHSASVALLVIRLKQDMGHMKYGSMVVLDEIDTCIDEELSLGDGSPPGVFAEMIKRMCERNGLTRPPAVCCDDMRGLGGTGDTVIDLLRGAHLAAHKPYRKDRVGNWNLIRQMLHNAKTGDGPGLFFTKNCPHLLETFPEVPRGNLRKEDSDPKFSRDHHL